MLFEQVTVVGVGLIGGSVGLAARTRRVAGWVVGVDRDDSALARALEVGAIDTSAKTIAEGVRGSQLIVVCTPVDRIVEVIRAAVEHSPGAIFTDVGSTKGGLYDAVHSYLPAGSEYVPAHPLAGSEQNGVESARADLFDNRVTVITPCGANPHKLRLVEAFWQALGSRVVQMTPEEHDRALAVTSHMPHAVAAAVAGSTPAWLLSLAAGGFRDVTRIAASDPLLWAAIFQANREHVLLALSAFNQRMDEFKRLLTTGDTAGLVRWLAEGKQVRDALGS
jgi:prephenate dehydrogenase